jgi:hypothetical protein
MSVEVQCPNCGNVGQVTDAMVGRTIKCKQCGDVFKATVRPTTPPPSAPRPAASAVPTPPTAPASDEPPAFADAVRLAKVIYQVTHALAVLVWTGCVLLAIAGVASGHAVEGLVVAIVAGVQMLFGVVGSMLVLSLVRVFVGLARDVRAVRMTLGSGRAD